MRRKGAGLTWGGKGEVDGHKSRDHAEESRDDAKEINSRKLSNSHLLFGAHLLEANEALGWLNCGVSEYKCVGSITLVG